MDPTLLTPAQIFDVSLCIAAAVAFSFFRTLADNRDFHVRGWDYFWLIMLNCAMGLAVGVLIVPLANIMNIHDRSWRVVAACFFGWFGLETLMKLVEEKMKGKFFDDTNQSSSGHSSGTGSLGRPDVPADPEPES